MTPRRRELIKRGGALALLLGARELAFGAGIVAVRVWPADEYTRVTIESDAALAARHFIAENPSRLVVDVDGLELSPALRDLVGDQTVARRSEARVPSLMERVSTQVGSTGPITNTVLRDYDIAADGFGAVLARLRDLVERDLRALGAAMETAGAPWTPGRGLPVWKR